MSTSRTRPWSQGLGRVLRAQPEVGRPAVVAVGDQGLVGGEFAADHRQVGRVGERPEAVVDAVLRGGRQERRLCGRALDQTGRARRRAVAPVGEEQRLQVGAGGAHEVRAVRDDVRHDVLVRQHQPLLRFGDAHRADHAPLHQAVAVALLVDVQAGFRVGGEDALGAPAAERLGGLGVALRGRARLGQDQADDVVRVGGLEMVQAVGADHDVVGRGCHGGQAADPVRVVPEASERGEFQPSGRRCRRVTCRVHPGIVRVSVPWGMIGESRRTRSDAE